MAGKFGASHYGEEIQETAVEKAERLLGAELKKLGWSQKDLEQRKKGDAAKVKVATRLRLETTMTLRWITERLHMGTKTHLAHLLYWQKRDE